ncbi:hypothetical protein ACVWYG_000595 [Pedobacter sp. UYEF25]
MNITKKCLVIAICLTSFSSFIFAQKTIKEEVGFYKNEMHLFQSAIDKNFYDKASGYYSIVVDTTQWEVKNGFLRKYTYLWAHCALYQAANEIQKLAPKDGLMAKIEKQLAYYYDPAPPAPGYSDYIMKLKPGERYYDDNEWIGITALDAYARTKQKKDLDQGKAMYKFMMTGHDQVLGGGLYWKEGSTSSKNTCSNGPGVLVALQLYQATKNKMYLDTALKIFNWTNAKLQAPNKLYYDNIKTVDGKLDKPILSYNTGTMLESYVYLYEITKDKKYLQEANAIADSTLDFFYSREKFRDGYWFNAVMLRAYQHLLKYNKDTKYVMGFKKCLDYALQNEKNAKGIFTGKDGVQNLVEQGGMLEILARFAWLEQNNYLASNKH